MLDESFNASAAEMRGLLGLVGTRSVLTLGVPLLAVLSREQLLAVIAHEFGHFSRRHGRLGHWLYRARVGWMQYAAHLTQSDSALDRAFVWYAELFVPYFSTRSFVHSRLCEYEADADGASAVGGETFAEALTEIEVLGELWSTGFPRRLWQWKREMPEAPADFYEKFAAAAEDWPENELQGWLAGALRAPSSWSDTHPSLTERLASLKQGPRLVRSVGSAGKDLLGASWPDVLTEFNAKWYRTARLDWSIDHLRYKHLLEPLLDGASPDWPKDRRLARARALRAVYSPDGLVELQALHQQYPGDPRVAFFLGAALLNENDESGLELLERVAKDSPEFRAPVYARLLGYQERRGNGDEIEKCSFRLTRAEARRTAAIESFLSKAERGETGESSLSSAVKTVLSEAILLDPGVTSAILVEGAAPLATQESAEAAALKIHCLVLTIDPQELARSGSGEDEVKDRYEQALLLLIEPDEQGIVRTYFATENFPQAFRSRARLTDKSQR
jgi:hypothetical protein